jgi:hypothetical protein
LAHALLRSPASSEIRNERHENGPANALRQPGGSSAFGFSGEWRATCEHDKLDEKEENMNQRLILIATLIVLTAIALLTQRHAAHSATSAVPLHTTPAEFAASTDRTFDR